jgi:anaerobic selenocysteine-containing dehydrogenase
LWPSARLRERIGQPWAALHPADAARLNLSQGQSIQLDYSGSAHSLQATVIVKLDAGVPAGIILVPRSFGTGLNEPAEVIIHPVPADQPEMDISTIKDTQ